MENRPWAGPSARAETCSAFLTRLCASVQLEGRISPCSDTAEPLGIDTVKVCHHRAPRLCPGRWCWQGLGYQSLEGGFVAIFIAFCGTERGLQLGQGLPWISYLSGYPYIRTKDKTGIEVKGKL